MVVKNLHRQMKTIVMKICFENNRKKDLVNNKNSKKKKKSKYEGIIVFKITNYFFNFNEILYNL